MVMVMIFLGIFIFLLQEQNLLFVWFFLAALIADYYLLLKADADKITSNFTFLCLKKKFNYNL